MLRVAKVQAWCLAAMDVRMSSVERIVCPACQYNLAGLPDGPCPECGREFSRSMFDMIEQVQAQNREEFWAWVRASLRTISAVLAVVCTLSAVSSLNEVGAIALVICLTWSLLSAAHPPYRGKVWNSLPIHIVFPVIPALLFGWVAGTLHMQSWLTSHITCTVSIALALGATCTRFRTAIVLSAVGIAPLIIRAVWLTTHAIERRSKGWHWTDFDWGKPHQLSSREAASISTADALWLGPCLIVASVAVVVVLCVVIRWNARQKLERDVKLNTTPQ